MSYNVCVSLHLETYKNYMLYAVSMFLNKQNGIHSLIYNTVQFMIHNTVVLPLHQLHLDFPDKVKEYN